MSVTLQVVASDTARSLQLEAMRCLLALCWCSLDDLCERPIDKEPISQDVRLRCQTVASFLPGIATAVSKVILGDSKQGQASVVADTNFKLLIRFCVLCRLFCR